MIGFWLTTIMNTTCNAPLLSSRKASALFLIHQVDDLRNCENRRIEDYQTCSLDDCYSACRTTAQ